MQAGQDVRHSDVHHGRIKNDHELGAEHDGQGHARPARRAGRIDTDITGTQRRQHASMAIWIPGARRRGDPEKPSGGLWWLTGRWPGGTSRNEAECYSGYYTEAPSAFATLLMTGTMTRPPDQPTARPADQLRADARQNHALLITAATAAFTEKGAAAPLEDIARRAGVGIGTLYRHFPTRLDLQAAVFRSQVGTVCGEGDALLETASPGQAFTAWVRSLSAYLVTKRGLSRALIEAVGVESELISSCWTKMRETTERLLANGQRDGVIRPD